LSAGAPRNGKLGGSPEIRQLPASLARLYRGKLHCNRDFFDMSSTRTFSVLVVDDEALLRWSLAEILRRHGHAVTEASSASSAREALSGPGQPFDLVFLDFRLPDSSDLGLLEEVRRRVPRGAVVLMTAYGTPEVVQGALQRGAYCVLTKPFDMNEMATLAQDACRVASPYSGH
jgi:DNA-binding NtrC family response regulator